MILYRIFLTTTLTFMIEHRGDANTPKPNKLMLRLSSQQKRALHYVCVLDFEANCGGRVLPEIIEFPSVLLALNPHPQAKHGQRFTLVDTFESFCKPTRPLTKFCTKLTSIRQDQVAHAEPFTKVFASHQDWLQQHLASGREDHTLMLVTCGNSDLHQMLPKQCELVQHAIPEPYTRWVNLQQIFRFHHPQAPGTSLQKMLLELELEPEGIAHRGIWDCKNTAKIVCEMHTRFGETFTRATNVKTT